MSIAIFKEVTTEEVLQSLEADGEKYTGLFVDMDNPAERKYVKDAASKISGMLKTLDRARIDKARDFKQAIEMEASSIKTRLEAANEPYTLLIDSHKEKRAAILAEKKAIEDAAELLIQIEEDHDSAVMEDKVRHFERLEAARLQEDRDSKIASEAAENATRESEAKAEREAKAKEDARLAEQARIDAEQAAREADTNHRRTINQEVLADLVATGMDTEIATRIIKLIVSGKIAHTSIKY